MNNTRKKITHDIKITRSTIKPLCHAIDLVLSVEIT